MAVIALLRIIQTEPAVADALGRIATMQTVLAISAGLVALALAVVGGYVLYLLVTLRRMMKDARRAVNRLSPKAEPALDRARRVLDGVSGTVENVRARVQDISDTIEEFNDSLRSTRAGAEERVRELTVVLDVVREEAQELLLDTAATARGIHATAEALRAQRAVQRPSKPEPPPPLPKEALRKSHGKG
jgi:uncharacterized protein YoxC